MRLSNRKDTPVHAKLRPDTYAKLKNYCDRQGTNPSRYIRDLIEKEIEGSIPLHQAGINRIEYDKRTDSFDWFIDFDNGPNSQIGNKLSEPFLQNLVASTHEALRLRENYLKKTCENSVSVPNDIKRIQGGKINAQQ